MNRGYNFGAGPSMLPEEVLLEAQEELLNWHGIGMSVMEVGHRTKEFIQLMEDSEQLLRKLLIIPDVYHVLFLGGPARLQFAMLPLNFIEERKKAGYLITGIWSEKAFTEACRVKNAYCIASSKNDKFLSVPSSSDWSFLENTSYLYYTPNETINGVRCVFPPRYASIPLVADMTSCLLSEPIKVSDYGLIFAGAQKNIANAGLTVVIIHDELLKSIKNNSLPTYLDYRTHVTSKSLYATPPTFNCYIAFKMFQWIERQGGITNLHEKNKEKAAKLYHYIDSSSFYQCPVEFNARSLQNICFALSEPKLEELFIKEATHNGLFALKGHRAVGGLRASMYNSMPIEGVEHLVAFMDNFASIYSH